MRSSEAFAESGTTSSQELMSICAPESGSTRVRVTLVVARDPKLAETKTGVHRMELDCQNDHEEGVRVIAWRSDADELAKQLRAGDLVQFAGLSVKKVFNSNYSYGALPYELHYTSGNGASSSFFVAQQDYRITGMPVASMHELDADIEFLRSATVDRRIRTRQVKAVVSDAKLQHFCKGVIGSVIAYDPTNQTRTLPMRLQIDFVPEQYRGQFVRGCKFEVRGKLSLPQLACEPVEFKVERYEDVDLTDSGVMPWIKGEKAPSMLSVQTTNRSREVSAASKPKDQGIVVSDFEPSPVADFVCWGLVYVKEMQTAVSVIVDGAKSGQLDFSEASMVEMRGELKSDGDGYQVHVQYPAIAKLGELPKFEPKPRRAAAKRARFVDLQSVSSILRVVEGKVMDVEVEDSGVRLDLFVKDSTGKGIVSVSSRVLLTAIVLSGGLYEYRVFSWTDVEVKCGKPSNSSTSSGSALNSPGVSVLKFNFDALTTGSPSGTSTVSAESLRSVGSSDGVSAALADVLPSNYDEVHVVSEIKAEPNADIEKDPMFAAMNGGGGRLPQRLRKALSTEVNGQSPLNIHLASAEGGEFLQSAVSAVSVPPEDAVFQVPLTPKRKSRTGSSQVIDGAVAPGDVTPIKRTRKTAPRFASTPRKVSTRRNKGSGRIDWTKSMVDGEAVEVDDPNDSVSLASDQDASFCSSIADGHSTSTVVDDADASVDTSAVAEGVPSTDFSELASLLNMQPAFEQKAENGEDQS